MHFSSEKENMTCQILMLLPKWSTYKKMCATKAAAYLFFTCLELLLLKSVNSLTKVRTVVNSIRLPNLIIRNCAHICENMRLSPTNCPTFMDGISIKFRNVVGIFHELWWRKLIEAECVTHIFIPSNDDERIDLLAAATFSFEFREKYKVSPWFSHSHTGVNYESDRINAARLHKITIYTFLKPSFTTYVRKITFPKTSLRLMSSAEW